MSFRIARSRLRRLALGLALLSLFSPTTNAQGPSPETAPPLFPGGGLVSYNSIFTTRGLAPTPSAGISLTARPTFSHEGDFNFTWGFRRDFDLTVLVPIVTNHFEMPHTTGNPMGGGTGLGDAMVLVKYRFYRRDSQRGTTQASVTLGPKVPTGRTDLADRNGNRLPASLQPGSGSTDFFVAANWTYTGLFNFSGLSPTRISIPYCAHRGRKIPASAAASNHVSGCRTGLMNRRTGPVNGSLALS